MFSPVEVPHMRGRGESTQQQWEWNKKGRSQKKKPFLKNGGLSELPITKSVNHIYAPKKGTPRPGIGGHREKLAEREIYSTYMWDVSISQRCF